MALPSLQMGHGIPQFHRSHPNSNVTMWHPQCNNVTQKFCHHARDIVWQHWLWCKTLWHDHEFTIEFFPKPHHCYTTFLAWWNHIASFSHFWRAPSHSLLEQQYHLPTLLQHCLTQTPLNKKEKKSVLLVLATTPLGCLKTVDVWLVWSLAFLLYLCDFKVYYLYLIYI